jgi:hypothetical protein
LRKHADGMRKKVRSAKRPSEHSERVEHFVRQIYPPRYPNNRSPLMATYLDAESISDAAVSCGTP